jgi:hypothetical protein
VARNGLGSDWLARPSEDGPGKAYFGVAGRRLFSSYFLIERYCPLADAEALAARGRAPDLHFQMGVSDGIRTHDTQDHNLVL